MSAEDAGEWQTLCGPFLSLLCLQQGGSPMERWPRGTWSPAGVRPGCLWGTERSAAVTSRLKWRFPDLFLQGLGVLKSHPQQSLRLNPFLCGLIYNTLCWGWVQLSVFIFRAFCQKTKQQKFHGMQNADLCIASEIFRWESLLSPFTATLPENKRERVGKRNTKEVIISD